MVTRAVTSEIERPKRGTSLCFRYLSCADTSTQAKSSSGTKRKISPYNKFVKEELARLKESHPDLTHKERLVFLASIDRVYLLLTCLS